MAASTCLRDTSTTTMSQDGSGNVGTDVKIHASDSGLGVVGDGMYVNNFNGGGIVRTSSGLFSRQTYTHAGWSRGINDVSAPGAAVGAGGYATVNPLLVMNFQRQGPQSQYIHLTYGVEMLMTLSDFPASNLFWGWSCQLESWFDWDQVFREVCSQGAAGPQNQIQHQLIGQDYVILNDDAVHTVQVRMSIRGGLAGTAICTQTQKRYIHADYH